MSVCCAVTIIRYDKCTKYFPIKMKIQGRRIEKKEKEKVPVDRLKMQRFTSDLRQRTKEIFTDLAPFFFKIAVVDVTAVISRCVAKNELKVCSSRGERDLRVTFPTAILKAYLTFFNWSISVSSVSDLNKQKFGKFV